jgi:hypothetical protein
MVSSPDRPTFEFFKNNLGTIEGNLALESAEPKSNVDLFFTWINWVETNDHIEQHKEYFYQQSLPKVVRSLLKRSYREDKDIESVRLFLQRAMSMTMQRLHLLELAALLPVFFDYKQLFYVRHGYPKPKAPSAHKRKHPPSPKDATPQWKLDLEEASCIDVLHLTRGWELCVVEEVLTASNQIRVSLPDGVNEFLNIDDDSRIAKYGTKTNLFGPGDQLSPEEVEVGIYLDASDSEGTPEAMDVMEIDADIEAGGQVTGAYSNERLTKLAMDSSRPTQWRLDLAAGSVIDAKNKSGVWHQGCILEMRVLTLAEAKCLDTTPTSAPASVSDDAPGKLASGSSGEPMDIDGVAAGVATGDDNDTTISDAVSDADADAATGAATDNATTNAATNAATITATYARVALLGFSESADEWVDVYDATSVQPLNSMSGGKRGDGVLREEVIYVVSNTSSAVKDQSVLYSSYYMDAMLQFYHERGFQAASEIISSSVTTGERHSNISLEIVLNLIIALGQCCPFRDCDEIYLYKETVLPCAIKRVNSLSNQEIRETSTDLLGRAAAAVEDICLVIFGRSNQGGQVVERHLLLPLAKAYLSCPYLNR